MPFGSPRASFYQRRIALIGLVALVIVFVVGAPWYLGRIEADLERRVSVALEAAGFDGITVSFSGQTGMLRCAEPLSRPSDALAVASTVRGVRSIAELPDGCRVIVGGGDRDDDPGDPSDTTSSEAPDATAPDVGEPIFGTVLDVLAADPQFSLLLRLVRSSDVAAVLAADAPVTVFAPSDAAFDALAPDVVAQLRSDPELLSVVLQHHLLAGRLTLTELPEGDIETIGGSTLSIGRPSPSAVTVDGVTLAEVDVIAGNGVVHTIDELLLPPDVDLDPVVVAAVSATFDGEIFVLDGSVRSEDERALLVATVSDVIDRLDDRLTIDPVVGLDGAATAEFAVLVGAVGEHLLSGTVVFDGDSFAVTGVVAGGPQRSAFERDVAGTEASVTLTLAPPVSEDAAAELEADLNALVAAEPIQFATGSTRIDADARRVLEAVARSVLRYEGVRITVEGYTDSDGVASENLTLSQARAEAVAEVLVELGIDPDLIDARGFGSERPIVVAGVEDKIASRRVEFRVEVS